MGTYCKLIYLITIRLSFYDMCGGRKESLCQLWGRKGGKVGGGNFMPISCTTVLIHMSNKLNMTTGCNID